MVDEGILEIKRAPRRKYRPAPVNTALADGAGQAHKKSAAGTNRAALCELEASGA
jgi:hypothetical protein